MRYVEVGVVDGEDVVSARKGVGKRITGKVDYRETFLKGSINE